MLVHFGELWLRGKNRPHYIALLKKDISSKLDGISFTLIDMRDRLVIRADEKDMYTISARLSHVFGISNYALASVAKPTMQSISKVASHYMKELKEHGARSIKINSHRSYKELNFDSNDIVKKLSHQVLSMGMQPMTKGFDASIFVNVTRDCSYIYSKVERGIGGLPATSSGKAVILLSGGIDSPVAAWLAMKRGMQPIYLHIHGFRSNSDVASTKMPRIIKILDSYVPSLSYCMPAYRFQIAATAASGRYEAVLFKAFALRIAEHIAKKEGAFAIYTGESMGQVASQTAMNIMASQLGIKIPVMRPLIGMDKEEIIAIARRIGTFNASIEPYKDVCSINAKNPSTAADPNTVKSIMKRLKFSSIIRESMKLLGRCEAT